MKDSERANAGATNANWIAIHAAGFGLIIGHLGHACWLRKWNEKTDTDAYGRSYKNAPCGSLEDSNMRWAIRVFRPAQAAIEATKLDAAIPAARPGIRSTARL